MCDIASDEQYDCMPEQPMGCVDVPAYNNVAVSEDWDKGMVMLLLLAQCVIIIINRTMFMVLTS